MPTNHPRGLVELSFSAQALQGAAILRDMLAGGGTIRDAVQLIDSRSPHLSERMSGMLMLSLRILDRAAAHGARLKVQNDDGSGWADLCRLRGHARMAVLERMLGAGRGHQAMTLLMQAAERCVPLLLERDGALPELGAEASREQATAQRVDIHIKWPEGAMPVEVRRMPDALTTTSLQRDSAGRITDSLARTTHLND